MKTCVDCCFGTLSFNYVNLFCPSAVFSKLVAFIICFMVISLVTQALPRILMVENFLFVSFVFSGLRLTYERERERGR
jgi:hypothetical protein